MAAAEHVAYAAVCVRVVCVLCLSSWLLCACVFVCVFLFASAAFDAVRSERAN